MATFTPYTYIQCPCGELFNKQQSGIDENLLADETIEVEQDQNFDPRAPRSNYSLYPIEHLLYCEDCRQIRCPRCVLDEIVTWYCPNCLFEVPSSTVKSEGNRCTRSCFQCPICVAPLTVISLDLPSENLGVENGTPRGPFILNCAYCMWTTEDIGIRFEKQNGIYAQLSKMKGNGTNIVMVKDRLKDNSKRQRSVIGTSLALKEDEVSPVDASPLLDPENQFSNLKNFYQSQLLESAPSSALGLTGDFNYGSPGTLSRIMGLYTGNLFVDEISKSRVSVIREAHDAHEGFQAFLSTENSEDGIIARLRSEGWENTTSCAQRRTPVNTYKRFLSDLKPTACLLRTKRSKRCRTCRQILSKPEAKVQSTRFRIRMIASNYIPSISIKPLHPSSPPILMSLKSMQFLLVCNNPLFDKIKVTLATPSETKGKYRSKTTVLCPQFEVGANTDVWDAALQEGVGKSGISEKRRTKLELNDGQQQAEAGKVWERGRNWVSVVLEVIPLDSQQNPKTAESDQDLRSEDNVCEIPLFVRVEWETDPGHDESSNLSVFNKTGATKESRELAYWCVLGVARMGNG